MDELEALVILTTISSLGPVKARLLIEHYGSAAEAVKATPAELMHLPGFGPKIVQAWEHGLKEKRWKSNLALAEKLGAQLIPFTSPQFPKRLLEIANPPILLYLKGTLTSQDQRSIAVVGTRGASIYGNEMAYRISRELAQAGYTVVSGLARGIDTSAHRGALEGGRTIGVLGSGLGSIYPQENGELAEWICQQGAMISEFSMDAPPDRAHFPQRNRIVSGLTLGTLLIEAPEESGAMLTVRNAIDQGRRVFALPGRADLATFKGNHALIKERKAELVESGNDLIRHFEELPLQFTFKEPEKPKVFLEKEEQTLLALLPNEELSIDEIGRHTGMPMVRLNILLMSLVLKKIIKQYPGKVYKKI